ncbi:zinc finger protein 248-like [Episyrphus balteatus]|uniref:zinc finger protein 248-like n=1 Tax=Episyrphus balteatus TaxID=286459 RepID=UPI002485D3BD|nr:zinc finger protein 248-like [Episyrphus balteatus]
MDDVLDIEDIITKLKSSLPICRVCLDVSMEYIEFEATLCVINGQEITFSEGFYELSPNYKYLDHENMPTYFCATCGKDLLNAYLFIKRTERANYALNKIKNITKESSSKFVANNHNNDKEDIKDHKELYPSPESENNSKIEEILPDKCVSNILETKDSIKLENHEEEYDYEEIFTHEEESMEKENFVQPEIQINSQEFEKWEVDWNVTDDVTTMLVCNECGFLTETEAGLNKHKNSEHENVEIELLPNKLTDSNLLFHELSDTKTNLDREQKESKNYKCNICSCTFETKKSLNIHNVRTHKIIKSDDQIELEDVKSQDCIQIVPNSLMETSSTTKSNQYNCTHCEKTFPTKIALKHHSNTHSKNPNRYSCHICGKCCSRPSTLKKTHSIQTQART